MATKEDSPIFNQYYVRALGGTISGITDYSLARNDQPIDPDSTIRESSGAYFAQVLDGHFGVDKEITDEGGYQHFIQEKCPSRLGYGTVVHPYKTRANKDCWKKGMAEYLSVGYKNSKGTGFDLWMLVQLIGFRNFVNDHPAAPIHGQAWKTNIQAGGEFVRVPMINLIMEQPNIVQAVQFNRYGLSVLIQQYRDWNPDRPAMKCYDPKDDEMSTRLTENREQMTAIINHQGKWIRLLDDSMVMT